MLGHLTMKLFIRGIVGVGAVCLVGGTPGATGEDTFTYEDHTFGFELQLPSDWEYDRARYPGNDGSIGLLRGWYGTGQRSLKLEIYRSNRPNAFPDWVESFAKKIAAIRGTVEVDVKTRNEKRGDCIIETKGTTAVSDSKLYYVCVPYDDRTVWVLSVSALGNVPDNLQRAEQTVETAYRTLKIHYSPAGQKELSAKLYRGRAVIDQLKSGALPVAIDTKERFYEMVGPDGPTGYISFRIANEVRRDKRGWRIRTHTWEFGRKSAARYVRTSAFCAQDFRSGLIETRQKKNGVRGKTRSDCDFP